MLGRRIFGWWIAGNATKGGHVAYRHTSWASWIGAMVVAKNLRVERVDGERVGMKLWREVGEVRQRKVKLSNYGEVSTSSRI